MNKYAIGNNLARRMAEMGVSENELAEAVNVSLRTMRRWIDGDRQITVYALKRCARYLETTMDELAKGVDDACEAEN